MIETITIGAIFPWNALCAKKNVKAERCSPMADMFSTHILCSFTYLTGADSHLLQIFIYCTGYKSVVTKLVIIYYSTKVIPVCTLETYGGVDIRRLFGK